mmetsp:Transcript_5103/g.13443  ORF Transcript_5103/g.13443 Transcript_5103/m.13443 type:complete len:401 (+) Transcript_5103:65-1267(+)
MRAVMSMLAFLSSAAPFGRLRTSDRLEQAARYISGVHASQGDVSSPPSPPGDSSTVPRLPSDSELAECVDTNSECSRWATSGECTSNPRYMLGACPAACQQCQSQKCHDLNARCGEWARSDECRKNHDYMLKECPFSCKVCGVNFKSECRRDPTMQPAAVAGTIDETFKLALQLHRKFQPRVLHREPWIIEFQNFLQPGEADHIIKTAGHNFERSLAGDGVTPVRTSSTSWCNVPHCLSDELFQDVRDRISNITRVPWRNAEHLQVLRYHPGQFYREHHDQNSPQYSAWGPRLFTFFMYLSDVDEGGETRFTKLNLTVAPRKGSAILWPSVKSEDPWTTEEGTYHEAVTVNKGVKYGANFWIHMFEFQEALQRGCDNEDYFQDMLLQRDDFGKTIPFREY